MGVVPRGADGLKGLLRRTSRPRPEPVLLDFIKKSAIADVEMLRSAPTIPSERLERSFYHL